MTGIKEAKEKIFHFRCTNEGRPFQKILYLLSILKLPVLLKFQLNPSVKKQVFKAFKTKDLKYELDIT